MRIPYLKLQQELERILIQLSFSKEKAALCSTVFADNSRDGFNSHGLNRFPVFVENVQQGLVDPAAEPEKIQSHGSFEIWDGQRGSGIYNATKAMNRAIQLAKENGIACVSLRNTNHWLRGGTYGWQAAEAGCVGICFTNAIANMPPWGGKSSTLGNNPLVIAYPRKGGHLILDMAQSQFSFGKLQEYQLRGESLPFPGGYDQNGELSTDPAAIRKSQAALPIGFWKGAGLAFMIDVLVSALSGGRSTSDISKAKSETGVSQLFICIQPQADNNRILEEIIAFTKSGTLRRGHDTVNYPGERTLERRRKSETEGITVNEESWKTILAM